MPPRNRSFAFQQLMNQIAAPSDTTGSFRQVQRDELFPGVISRDFARSRAIDPTISKYDEAYSGNPIMDLAQNMYQGGVGDTRGTGGMPGSGSDPMNFTPPAEPPMQTGSFRRVPRPIFDAYSEGMEGMAGMPGSGSSDMIPAYNAQNVVEQSNPFMQLRVTDPQVGLPSLAGYDYPEDPEGTNLEPEVSGSFRRTVNPTEAAYQASLPGINRIQTNAQTQMAMNRGDLDSSPMDIRRSSELSPYAEDLPQNMLREQAQEAVVPQEMQPGMMYRAGQTVTDIAGRAVDAAPGVADKTARGIGGAARGLAGFGGNILNAFLYGNTGRDLASNLNQTLYGGKRSLRENVLGMPAPKKPPQSQGQGIGPTPSGKPMGGFKSAFAAARKAGNKEFTYNGKKYTTALASSGAKTAVKKPVAKKTAAKKTTFKKRGTVTRYSGRENARRGN